MGRGLGHGNRRSIVGVAGRIGLFYIIFQLFAELDDRRLDGPGGSVGQTGKKNTSKEQQKLDRKAEREARVGDARMEYAKRERQKLWDAEDTEVTAQGLTKILNSATE